MLVFYSYKIKAIPTDTATKIKSFIEIIVISNLGGIPPIRGFIAK